MLIVGMNDMGILGLGVSGDGGDTWRQKLNVGCAVVFPARMLVVGDSDVWIDRVDTDFVVSVIVGAPEVDVNMMLVICVVNVASGMMLALVDDAIGIINLMLGATAACPGSVSDGDIDAHSSRPVLL